MLVFPNPLFWELSGHTARVWYGVDASEERFKTLLDPLSRSPRTLPAGHGAGGALGL